MKLFGILLGSYQRNVRGSLFWQKVRWFGFNESTGPMGANNREGLILLSGLKELEISTYGY